ncbi:MAG: hypothetical protein HY548_07985, partial [Elusimicrobia bacterium]|nr:hypothetical protein [Elusimicrobiota bacterium]
MRITLRLIVSLVFAVAAVATLSSLLQIRRERETREDTLERRSLLLAARLQDRLDPHLQESTHTFITVDGRRMHIHTQPFRHRKQAGAFVILQKADSFNARRAAIWRHNFLHGLVQMALISLV